MIETGDRQRYISISKNSMVQKNQAVFIEAILDPSKTMKVYEDHYPDYQERLQTERITKTNLKRMINRNTIPMYIHRLLKLKTYIKYNTRETFKLYLLNLSEEMNEDRKNVNLKGLVIAHRNSGQYGYLQGILR